MPLFSAAKFLAHMKVKQQDAKVSPKSSKNMKHSSQNNPAGLVHIQVGCVFLHFSPCCFFFLLNIGEAIEIQLCPLFSVTALGKQPDAGLEQNKQLLSQDGSRRPWAN